MNQQERQQILEDELLIVRHSGEIPEIAYHATIHYLTEDPEGPGLTLTDAEVMSLQDGALARAREIVLRDLDPANRDLTIYRGIKRTIYNWQRWQDFLARLGRNDAEFRQEVRGALVAFLAQEKKDVQSGARASSINCTVEELAVIARELGCRDGELPAGWQELCQQVTP